MAREGLLSGEAYTSGAGFDEAISEEKKSGRSGRLWLVLAIILFVLDYAGGSRYTGFKWMWGAGNYSSMILSIATSAVFFTIVFVYYVFKIAKRGWSIIGKDDIFFLIFALVLSFFLLNYFWLSNPKAVLHLASILFFGLFFIRSYEENSVAYLFTSILLIVDFFGYALLKNIFILQYIPILTVFVIIYIYVKTEDPFSIIMFIVLAVMLFILMWNDPAIKNLRGDFTFFAPENAGGVTLSDLGRQVLDGIRNYRDRLTDSYRQQMEFATGGYYQGQVEEAKEEPLGVYLENLQAAGTKFYEDEPVIVWADLRAKTLKEEEPVNIKVRCVSGTEDNPKTGIITPRDSFDIATMEAESIQCKFPITQLKPGTHNIELSAEFNFETMAYLKTYFMDINRMRALRRENIDPLDQYGITDKNPVAIFTNGPVKIGIGTNEYLPIGLSKEYSQQPRLGLTIENQWNGQIQNITSLIIQIPKPMELETSQQGTFCNGWFIEKSEARPDDYDYNTYNITKAGIEKFGNEPITGFRSIRCMVDIIDLGDSDIRSILGNTPVSIQYYRVQSKYIYRVRESITVTVEEVEGAKTILDNCDTTCQDSDGCRCPDGCVKSQGLIQSGNIASGENCGGNA